MKRLLISVLTISSLLLTSSKVVAQLLVDNTLTPTQLASLISGQGVQILNPQVNCAATGYGKYNATNSNLNITEGLLLTTGTIADAVGPNNVSNKTTYFGSQNTPSTYSLLNNYTGRTTWEYCEFEFDIIPQGDTLSFEFVFASEEYEEWVGSQYNDVFGFFISGPGIVPDAGAGVYHNIALLPNTSTAVTINNVNQNLNTQYYQSNLNGTSVQYDGFTRGLKAISGVQPCQTYHLKLVVADVSDKLWDSGVFIEKIKSNNILLLSQTAGGIPNMVEGCNFGTISFTRQTVTNQPLTVQYWLDGTATNGTDYPQIGASPNPLSPKTITIPANQATASINIDPFQDGINEGLEYITVYLGNPYCSNSITDSLRFYIQDSLFTTVSPVVDSICIGQSVQLSTTGGGSAFNWLPVSGLNFSNITNPIATPTATTTYTLTTTASNCVKNVNSTIHVSNISLAFSSTNVTCNGLNNGMATVTPSGGFSPYTYSWSGPSGFTASTAAITNLAPGTYTVIVTGKKGCSKTGTVTITEPTSLTSSVTSPTYNGGFNISCFGAATGAATVVANGGTTPYTYSWSPSGGTSATANGLSAGVYTVTVTDNKACTSIKTITLTQPVVLSGTITAQTNVLCKGNSTGSATVTPAGGTAPYTYSWNTTPIQTLATASNLAAGTYNCTIKDANNCSVTVPVTITQPAAVLSSSLSAQVNVLCRGNSTGSATVTTTGGTAPYTYSWNTTPVQTAATAINLAAGNYVVTVKDVNNCSVTVPVTILQPATNLSANISAQTNVLCFGNNTGSATVSATGGTPGYTYSWNTTPVQTSSTASNLTVGTYTCTVKDLNNCTFTVQAVITQPLAVLSASIAAQTNVLCKGNTTGTATISSTGGTAPYTYSWNTAPLQTTATANNLAAGTYTCTVKDANNCLVNVNVTITEPATVLSASLLSKTDVTCFGGATGAATVTSSGGTPSYTYSWNTAPIQTTATASNLAAGTYTCTVKDANNCSKIITVVITQPTALLSVSISSSIDVLCKNDATGSITALATGGSGSYSYAWNSTPVQTTAIATNLIAGNYTVTVTDNNGCVVPAMASVTINEPAAILSASSVSPLFNGNNISCFGGSNGSIDLSPLGGTLPYTYAWTGPNGYSASSEDINSLEAGVYDVTITDSHGCITTDSKTLTEPTQMVLTNSVTSATCPLFNDGAIDLTVSGGTSPFSFSWSGPGAFSALTEDISGLLAGSYSVLVTDANGCTKSSTITVTQPSTMVVSNTVSAYPGGVNVSCFGGNNGSIDVTVVGGTPFAGPAYNYLWSGPGAFSSATQDVNTLTAGTYEVVVTDANGCIASKTITLTEPAAVTSTLTPAEFNGGYNISCNGTFTGSVNLSATGGTAGYTYVWNGPNGFNAASQNITALEAGTYNVVVTDVNSCTGNNTIILTEPALLVANATSPTLNGGNNISCNGLSDGSINLSVNGGTAGYTYAWTGPSGFISSLQNPTNVIAGVYNVIVSDSNGCLANTNITLTEPVVLSASAISPTVVGGYNITCNGASDGAINLNVTGGVIGYSYAWTGANGFTATTQNLSGLIAGVYNVIVTDTNNCTASTAITLTEPVVLSVTATSPTVIGGYNITCNGASDGSINLSVNGGTTGYSYAWSGPSGYTSAQQNPTNVIAGTYNVIVTDSNGCVANTNVTLTEPLLLSTTISSPTVAGGYNITCNGLSNGSINLAIAGGTSSYNYVWTGPSGFNASTEDISSLASGTYTVVVTDANNCTTTTNITLTEPLLFAGTVSSSTFVGGNNISCSGLSDGEITLVLGGGTLPYTYNWSNGQSTQNLVGLPAENYSVIVTDANNCTFTQSITLTEPDVLTADASSPTVIGGYNINCAGNTNGTIDLGVGGGVAAYTYAWTGPSGFNASTEDISSLAAGVYNVSVTDANNCTVNTSLTLTEPVVLDATLSSATVAGGYNVICNGNSDGSITSLVTGGTPLYNYSWSGPLGFTSNTADLSLLIAGTYTLTVTDTNTCSVTTAVTLTEPAVLMATASSTLYAGGFNISCNGLSDGDITLNVTGGTTTYSYDWTGPNGFVSTSQNIGSLAQGSYDVLITDANSCTFNLSQTLTEPLQIADTITPSLFVGGNNISCNGVADGTISLVEAGGASPYNQTWSGPNGFVSSSTNLSGLDAGYYYVTITDANLCVKTDSIELTEPVELTSMVSSPTYIGGNNIKCNGDSSGVISNVVAGGNLGYSYSWTGPNGFTASTQELLNVEAGTYNLTVTDTNGCLALNTITLTETPVALTGTLAPSVFVGGANISCYGLSDGSIDLTFAGGTPGYTFWWRGPGLLTFDTEDISGLPAGDYDLVVTDTNNCQLALSITITEPVLAMTDSVYSATYNGNVNVSCYGFNDGIIDLMLSGGEAGFSYNWAGPNGFTAASEDLTNLFAGTYTVDVTDANGCMVQDTIMLTEPNQMQLTANPLTYNGNVNISCNGLADGAIDLSVTGGTVNYQYNWTGSAGYTSNTEDIASLPAGNYAVIVTDNNNCKDSIALVLIEPTVITSFVTSTPATCSAANGSVDLTVAGGTTPYSYTWSNSATTEDLYGVAGNTYYVQITDANNCTKLDSGLVNQISIMSVNAVVNNVLCYNNSDGFIDLSINNGIAPLTYSWSTGDTIQDLLSVQAGTYQVIITDGYGCSVTETYVVTQSPQLVLDLTSPVHLGDVNISSYQGNDGAIDLTVTGGNAPYQYSWSNNAITEDVYGLPVGTYSVIVTDSAGCTSFAKITLIEPLPLQMPTGISPNGDGRNDYFVVHGLEVFPNNHLTIFNRWGNIVFEKDGYQNDWGGTNNSGDALPVGTYFVILEINNSDIVLKGYVDLRRE